MKINLTGIENIIFDLGKVLLNLDFEASIKVFRGLGLNNNVISRQQAYADPVFYNLEVGKIEPVKFRKRIREILKNPNLSDKQIDDAWYAMILDIPEERVKKLQKLGSKFNLYLFSNTNKIHIERLHQDFKTEYNIELSSLFKRVFYSHEIHERKPDLNSYKKVIELAGIEPSKTLFVDDLEKNIAGAEKAGLKTLWLKEEMEMAQIF